MLFPSALAPLHNRVLGTSKLWNAEIGRRRLLEEAPRSHNPARNFSPWGCPVWHPQEPHKGMNRHQSRAVLMAFKFSSLLTAGVVWVQNQDTFHQVARKELQPHYLQGRVLWVLPWSHYSTYSQQVARNKLTLQTRFLTLWEGRLRHREARGYLPHF